MLDALEEEGLVCDGLGKVGGRKEDERGEGNEGEYSPIFLVLAS